MFPLHFVSKGIRRRVLPTTEIPGNWQSFLRLDENERELFGFLANEVTKEETENLIISTIGSSVITNRSFDNVSTLCPSNHEEADTRMLLHAANASPLMLLVLLNVMTCHSFMHLPDMIRFHFLQEKGRKAYGEPGKTSMM